jgi:hypothetical protein
MEDMIARAIVAGISGEAGAQCCWGQIWEWGYWISFIVGVAGSVYLLIKKDPKPI